MKFLSVILQRLFGRTVLPDTVDSETLALISDYERELDKMGYDRLLKEACITDLTAKMNKVTNDELRCLALRVRYNRINLTRIENERRMAKKINELKAEFLVSEEYMKHYLHQN